MSALKILGFAGSLRRNSYNRSALRAAQAPRHLEPSGKVAVIATSLNDGIKKTISELEERVGHAQILAEESFFFEKIALIEAQKR